VISRDRAVDIAAGWHSVNTWHDPGVTMYAFSSTGKVQSPEHRADLMVYITSTCRPLVAERLKDAKAAGDAVAVEAAGDEWDELDDLLEYVTHARLEDAV
jgi:hypothetical protein